MIDSQPFFEQLLVAALIFMLVEYFFAAQRNQPWRHQIYDLYATAVFAIFSPLASMITGAAAVTLIAKTIGPILAFDLNSIQTGSRLADAALFHVFLPFVPLVLFDFGYYWVHRLQHRWPILWEQHKFHHTAQSVNFFTAHRHHLLEYPVRTFIAAAPLSLVIELTPLHGAYIGIFLAYWGYFIHANVRLYMGPLTAIFSGPQYHRIHHSIELKHRDKNFAAFFPFWDMLFDSYYRPSKHEFPATGVTSEGHGRWHDIATMPFIGWTRMISRVLNRGSSKPQG